MVRLEDVASIGVESTSNLIARENGRRKATISCNVAASSNLGDLVAEVITKVDPIVEKYGYAVEYGGQFEAQQSASRLIMALSVFSLIAIYLTLQLALGHPRAAAQVMVNHAAYRSWLVVVLV